MKWLQNMASGKGGNLPTMTIAFIYLFHVKCWGWQHPLWGHVGGMQCLGVANMLQTIIKFVVA
jgi:hypothetical protein